MRIHHTVAVLNQDLFAWNTNNIQPFSTGKIRRHCISSHLWNYHRPSEHYGSGLQPKTHQPSSGNKIPLWSGNDLLTFWSCYVGWDYEERYFSAEKSLYPEWGIKSEGILMAIFPLVCCLISDKDKYSLENKKTSWWAVRRQVTHKRKWYKGITPSGRQILLPSGGGDPWVASQPCSGCRVREAGGLSWPG